MPLFEFECPDHGRFELLLPLLPEDETAICRREGCLLDAPLVPSRVTMKPDSNWFYGEEVGGEYLNSASKIARAKKERGIVDLNGCKDVEAMKKAAERAREERDKALEAQTHKHFEESFAGQGVIDSFGEVTPEAARKITDERITTVKASHVE